MPQPNEQRLPEEVLALQRAFAGHVLRLRGSLTNANDEGAPNVDRLDLVGHDNGTVEVGREVQLRDAVRTPPIAAFFNTLSLPIRAVYDSQSKTYTVFLTVPPGTQPAEGQVTLRWPIREIPAEPRLRLVVVAGPAYLPFDLEVARAPAGQRIPIARFPSPPVEVEFGDVPVAAGRFWYMGDLLEAEVPHGAWDAKIRVSTANGDKYRSNRPFVLNRIN